MKKPLVLVVVGPTASGKTELGIKLAKEFDGEIVSADSRQVYKGLDVGTGKVTREEMRGIPHHMLDIVDLQERFTASEYGKLGLEALKGIIQRKKLTIIVGGTGLYVDALSCGINFPEVPPNKELRKEFEKKSIDELLDMLKKKDLVRAKEIDPKNKRRIIRALEIVDALGEVPKLKKENSPYEFVYIGLKIDQEELEEKIELRLEKRTEGMVAEAKALHRNGLSFERMKELGLEYKFLAMYMQNEITLDEMREKLFIAIRQYSKRQVTWFKRNKKIRWFKPEEYEEIKKYATIAFNKGD